MSEEEQRNENREVSYIIMRLLVMERSINFRVMGNNCGILNRKEALLPFGFL